MRLPRVWGATEAETAAAYPCDRYATPGAQQWFRAVGVAAAPGTVYGWLCQLRAAPYSYDLLDNLGRRSPRRRDPDLEDLEPGQRVMTIFRLDGFERPGHDTPGHLTLILDDPRGRRLFGDIVVTYAVRAAAAPGGGAAPAEAVEAPSGTRLVAKLVVPAGRPLVGPLRRAVIGWGDLLMMRKQLLTLKRLAEADPGVASGPDAR